MRILLSASTFPLRRGDGLPAFVWDLARSLSQRMEVSVLAPGAPGAPEAETGEDVRVHRFTYFVPRSWQRLAYGDGIDVNLRRSWRARATPPFFLAAQARATRSLVAEHAIDLVNSHWILPQGLTAALARGRAPRFGHVVTLHGGDVHLLARLPGRSAIARFILGRSDALLASSTSVRSVFDAALGEASNAVIQPMGVDTSRFRHAEPPDPMPFPDGYLLYVGRLQEIKGVRHLLRALPRVRERHPGIGLVVVGYGEQEAALRSEAHALGLADGVHFTGQQPAPEVARWLSGCRVAVVPSQRMPGGRSEGMPTVVLEAMAAGAPLVATKTGGIPDVVQHGRNGWLCRDRDPEALADAVFEALSAGRGAVAEATRATSEHHDWARVAERYAEIFDRALGGVQRPTHSTR